VERRLALLLICWVMLVSAVPSCSQGRYIDTMNVVDTLNHDTLQKLKENASLDRFHAVVEYVVNTDGGIVAWVSSNGIDDARKKHSVIRYFGSELSRRAGFRSSQMPTIGNEHFSLAEVGVNDGYYDAREQRRHKLRLYSVVCGYVYSDDITTIQIKTSGSAFLIPVDDSGRFFGLIPDIILSVTASHAAGKIEVVCGLAEDGSKLFEFKLSGH